MAISVPRAPGMLGALARPPACAPRTAEVLAAQTRYRHAGPVARPADR